MILLPQLPPGVCRILVEERRTLPIDVLSRLAAAEHPGTVYTPTGGTRALPSLLINVRTEMLALARAAGWPDAGDDDARRRFDADAAVLLHRSLNAAPAEAARGGVWEFLAAVLLPDVVRWRFPGGGDGTAPARFLAGRRNAFQRLWWRAHLVRDESADAPYGLLFQLYEDEIVQILERPNLAGIPHLTRAVGRELLAAAARHGGVARRDLIRDAQKRIMRLSAFVCLEAFAEPALRTLAEGAFEEAARRAARKAPA